MVMESLSSWQDFLDQITKKLQHNGALAVFRELKSNRERSKFCRTHSLISSNLNDWLLANNHGNESNYKKNRGEMFRLKADGNAAYVGKNEDKAIELYNSALLYASDTDSALLYGNRSAVLFSQGKWKKCVMDIDAAITSLFPKDKLWKLYKRKGEALMSLKQFEESNKCLEKALECLEGIGKMQPMANVIKELMKKNTTKGDSTTIKSSEKEISYTETIPYGGWSDTLTYGSSCLTVKHDCKQGRYIVANRDIPSGSVIILEKPFAAVLLPPWYKTHCNHCFVKVTIMFPCNNCSQVCYCSESCRKDSWVEYHHFECQKLDLLEKVGIARLAIRVNLAAPLDELHKFKSLKQDSIPALSILSGCDENGAYRGDYNSVFHLLPHSEHFVTEDLFQYSVAGIMLLKVLNKVIDNNNDVRKDGDGDDDDDVGGLLIRHIQQLVCNAHAITSLNDTVANQNSNIVEQDQVRIATAIYPTTSLFNHSCEPTILNCFQNNRLIVKTASKVCAGEQIYSCYGPHFRRMDFTERQNALKQQYFFDCLCTHCRKGISSNSELNCYSCIKCKYNIKDCTYCSKCDTDLVDHIKYCKEQYKTTSEMFKSGLTLLQSGPNDKNIHNALGIFQKCVQIQEKILYKFHKDLAKSYDVIGRCFALLSKYENCILFIKQSVDITEKHYGKDSVEVTNELLKLSDVYMATMQYFIDQKTLNDKIQIYLQEATGIVERTIVLVNKNKEPYCEDSLLLKERMKSLKKLKYLSR